MCISCSTLYSDEKLTLPKTPFIGNELRIDGYYYHVNNNLTTIYFLYRDGILLYVYSHRDKSLDEIEMEMLNNDMYNANRNNKGDKTRWGVFLIEDNNIQFERWDAGTGGGLPTVKNSGYIENDTTFRITRIYRSDTKNEISGDWVYHFKQFSPKPDSTNVFIK